MNHSLSGQLTQTDTEQPGQQNQTHDRRAPSRLGRFSSGHRHWGGGCAHDKGVPPVVDDVTRQGVRLAGADSVRAIRRALRDSDDDLKGAVRIRRDIGCGQG